MRATASPVATADRAVPVATTDHAVTFDDYPAISVRLKEQGVVSIAYIVDADGNVHDVQVTKSSGHDRLDEAAITMVKKRWKFAPATQEGKPIATRIEEQVSFRLQ